MKKKWSRRMLLALLLLALLASAFLLEQESRLSAQDWQRLQLQGETSLSEAPNDGWYAVKVQAICDTGNGSMLYIIRNASENAISVKLLPNGCRKAQAER